MKPGVRELLFYAKNHGIKTAVATSSRREYSTRNLSEAGIWSLFDGAVFGDQVENAKPDPEIYLTACAMVDAAPSKSIALEDSPAGILSASAAGMFPIMIPDLVQPTADILSLCTARFDSLLEVIPFLERSSSNA